MFGAGALALLFAAVVWRIGDLSSSEPPFEPKTKMPQAAPLCPWREPESDLKRFFPNATRYEPETRILSGQRLELAERLGRVPTGDENALHLYRSYEEQSPLGTVLTRRVKGGCSACANRSQSLPRSRIRIGFARLTADGATVRGSLVVIFPTWRPKRVPPLKR